MIKASLSALVFALGLTQVSMEALAQESRGFMSYCQGTLGKDVTPDEAYTVAMIKLSLKYKGPAPYKMSTKVVYGENGQVIRPMDAVSMALFKSASLACETKYFGVSLVGRSMSSLSRAFFGLRQWMPFFTLTT